MGLIPYRWGFLFVCQIKQRAWIVESEVEWGHSSSLNTSSSAQNSWPATWMRLGIVCLICCGVREGNTVQGDNERQRNGERKRGRRQEARMIRNQFWLPYLPQSYTGKKLVKGRYSGTQANPSSTSLMTFTDSAAKIIKWGQLWPWRPATLTRCHGDVTPQQKKK